MLNFPTFPTTFCLFICWVPPSLRNGDCATTIFAANGGTLLCTRQVVLSRYPWIQVEVWSVKVLGSKVSMKRIHTSSTSASSAACSPIILRTTATTRLIFRPAIVDNLHDTQACVRGSFIFQKKGIKDTWEDVKETNLAELKKAEGIELELHSGEVLALYQGVSALYGIHRTYGVPYGDQVFVNPRLTLQHVLGLRDDELANLGRATVAALSRLVRWAINQRDLPDMLDEL